MLLLAWLVFAGTFAMAASNRAPVVVARPGPLTLSEGGEAARFHMKDFIRDPDGDPLGYGVAIPRFVSLRFDGAVMTVAPWRQGSETISVRATDPSGLYADLVFSVTVGPANGAPVVLTPIGDMTLTVGGRSETVALSSHFQDPEGEELAFSATSANPETVTVAIAKDVLTVSAVALAADKPWAPASGKTTVTVVASDPGGSRSPATAFDVRAKAPVPVKIPDAKLRAGLELWLEKEAGETITNAEMERMEEFVCESCGVSDLTGLEYAASLSELEFDDNAVTDLKPISRLPNLREVDLSNNPVRNLAPLKDLPKLRTLVLSENKMSDLSSLAGLVNVTRLGLSRNLISDLSPLAGLTGLAELSLFDNRITDVRFLAGLTNLRELWLRNNSLTDIQPLSSLAKLEALSLDRNSLTDVRPLFGLTDLRWLSLDENSVTDIASLSGLKNLEWLSLDDNSITSLPVSGLRRLSSLSVRNNFLTELAPLSGLTGLSRLDLEGNCLTSIEPLRNNPGLGQGDQISLQRNAFTSTIAGDVAVLRDRGARVTISWPSATGIGRPVNVSAFPGHRHVALTWDQPLRVYRPLVYEMRSRSATGTFSDWAIAPCSSKGLHHLSGLVNGTTYTVELRAAGRASNGVASVTATPSRSGVTLPAWTMLWADLTAPGKVPWVSEVNPYDGYEIDAAGAWPLRVPAGTDYAPRVYLREFGIVQKPPPEELDSQVEVRLSTSSAAFVPPPSSRFGGGFLFTVHDRGLNEALVEGDGTPFVTSTLSGVGGGRFIGKLEGDVDAFWEAIGDDGDYDLEEGLYVELRRSD